MHKIDNIIKQQISVYKLLKIIQLRINKYW